MSYKRYLKKTYIWKFFIQIFFYPIYNIIWQYIINFNAKLLYFFWFFKKREFIKFDKNDKILVKDNSIFKEISKKILQESLPLLEESKKEILSEEYKKKLSLEIGASSVDAEMPYRIGIYEKLSENLKKEIIAFASSDLMISTAARYMGIFPILTRIQVDHNVPREGTKVRGAMHWHRDTFGFKNLDFFMAITDIDDENGPFYTLEKKVKAGTFMAFSNLVSRTKKGERGKVSAEEFSKYFKNDKILKLAGDSGTAIFLDSFSCYHKGGFCKSKDRLTIRFCYQSQDVLVGSQVTESGSYKYDKSLYKKDINNIFMKFFLFKRPSKLMKYFSNKIVNFYRKIDFEV
jgi:hypothetical protein